MGAPPKCVTRWVSMAPRIFSALISRISTSVPAIIVIVQAWHQPLQWNIGTI